MGNPRRGTVYSPRSPPQAGYAMTQLDTLVRQLRHSFQTKIKELQAEKCAAMARVRQLDDDIAAFTSYFETLNPRGKAGSSSHQHSRDVEHTHPLRQNPTLAAAIVLAHIRTAGQPVTVTELRALLPGMSERNLRSALSIETQRGRLTKTNTRPPTWRPTVYDEHI